MWVGVSFLLRPAEYLHTGYDTHTVAFRMADIQFRILGLNTPSRALRSTDLCSHVGVHFTTQKNGISGEIIWLAATGHTLHCPVACLRRRILHLLDHRAPPTTPIHTFINNNQRFFLSSRILTSMLRIQALTLAPNTTISIAGLRATGATALLNAGTALPLIKLVGRWRSDEVFRYFHAHSTTTDPLSTQMHTHLT
jgi:hypothetical protein